VALDPPAVGASVKLTIRADLALTIGCLLQMAWW
jgi:hypothetical protein